MLSIDMVDWLLVSARCNKVKHDYINYIRWIDARTWCHEDGNFHHPTWWLSSYFLTLCRLCNSWTTYHVNIFKCLLLLLLTLQLLYHIVRHSAGLLDSFRTTLNNDININIMNTKSPKWSSFGSYGRSHGYQHHDVASRHFWTWRHTVGGWNLQIGIGVYWRLSQQGTTS